MGMKTSSLIWLFLWSIFMGVTACSIGVGAVYPPLNYIAAPLLCPGGQMGENSTVYNPYPGTTVTTEDWICTNDTTGAQTPVSIFKIALVSGPIYGVVLFVLVFVLRPVGQSLVNRSRAGSSGYEDAASNQAAMEGDELDRRAQSELDQRMAERGMAVGSGATDDSEHRLRELEHLRTSNLITQAEYDQKRTEILNSL